MFRPLTRLSAAAARICRCGALMFTLLLAVPLLPLDERRWMMLALLAVFAILVFLILRDAVVLWRTGVWFDAVDSRVTRGETVRQRAAPQRLPSLPPPRRDVLVWADEPEPVAAPATVRTLVAPVARAAPAERGVTIEVQAFDDGVVELGVHVADGMSAASTTFAERLELALQFGDGLRGFSGQASDRRDAQLGSFDPAARGGGLRVVLFSREGQCRAYVTVWPDIPDSAGLRQTTSFAFEVDAKELCTFASALSAALLRPGSRVVMQAARS